MTAGITPLSARHTWKALTSHHKTVGELHPRKLFAEEPTGGARLTAEAVGLYLDYSKYRSTDETLRLLLPLAEESGWRASTACSQEAL